MNVTSVLTEGGASSAVLRVCGLFSHIRNPDADCPDSGISDAYYCAECTRLEKDRDGCPKIVNLGASRTDLFYERRRLGQCAIHVMSAKLADFSLRLQEGIMLIS